MKSDAQKHKKANALIHESSPYLLQHAFNPVDWHSWSEIALDEARRQDKPIFLSIGYSTCHWCHVMEVESFEDRQVADILNRDFIPIKVDREERPDIDGLYMNYVQAATGSGGWPLSVWLTPDLKPFMGGTYFPPEDKWGRVGFKNILLKISGLWRDERKRIDDAAKGGYEALKKSNQALIQGDAELSESSAKKAYEELSSAYDATYGGFGEAPKFPQTASLNFLLEYHRIVGDDHALQMSLNTLRKIAWGGIHDHVGGGFHRYAVDREWQLPHFEKMLYDQALLACTFIDAFLLSGDNLFEKAARDTLDYVEREMTGESGQFFSAQDADSPSLSDPDRQAEGAFYVWRKSEICDLLGEDTSEIFAHCFDIREDGNVKHDPNNEFRGQNVLIMRKSHERVAEYFGSTPDHVEAVVEAALGILEDERRNNRKPPQKDDKSITAWNGMMISAFARASAALGEPRYSSLARAATKFVKTNLSDNEGKLLRRFRHGKAAIAGYAEDYVFFIRALLDLYQDTFDPKYIEWAVQLQGVLDQDFRDAERGGYFSTSGQDPSIILRIKEYQDGATPSHNSIAAVNLMRLGSLCSDSSYYERADKCLESASDLLNLAPHAAPQMVSALQRGFFGEMLIVICGDRENPVVMDMLARTRRLYLPTSTVILVSSENFERLANINPVLKDSFDFSQIPMAHVCRESSCGSPIFDADELENHLVGANENV